jgi:hypothetical protein
VQGCYQCNSLPMDNHKSVLWCIQVCHLFLSLHCSEIFKTDFWTLGELVLDLVDWSLVLSSCPMMLDCSTSSWPQRCLPHLHMALLISFMVVHQYLPLIVMCTAMIVVGHADFMKSLHSSLASFITQLVDGIGMGITTNKFNDSPFFIHLLLTLICTVDI